MSLFKTMFNRISTYTKRSQFILLTSLIFRKHFEHSYVINIKFISSLIIIPKMIDLNFL